MNKYILNVNVTGNLFFVILVITDSNGCEFQKKKTNKVLYRHGKFYLFVILFLQKIHLYKCNKALFPYNLNYIRDNIMPWSRPEGIS